MGLSYTGWWDIDQGLAVSLYCVDTVFGNKNVMQITWGRSNNYSKDPNTGVATLRPYSPSPPFWWPYIWRRQVVRLVTLFTRLHVPCLGTRTPPCLSLVDRVYRYCSNERLCILTGTYSMLRQSVKKKERKKAFVGTFLCLENIRRLVPFIPPLLTILKFGQGGRAFKKKIFTTW